MKFGHQRIRIFDKPAARVLLHLFATGTGIWAVYLAVDLHSWVPLVIWVVIALALEAVLWWDLVHGWAADASTTR